MKYDERKMSDEVSFECANVKQIQNNKCKIENKCKKCKNKGCKNKNEVE